MVRIIPVLVLLLILPGSRLDGEEVGPLLAKIKAVGKEGKGSTEAAKAWRTLIKEGPDALTDILAALKDSDPRAANWLRSAVDAIAERTLQAGKPLPAAKLEAFARDGRNPGNARRLSYEWLVKSDASAPDRLLPTLVDDPAAEMRRDAIAALIKDAEKVASKNDKQKTVEAYKNVLKSARDADQVKLVIERLKKLDVEVDLTAHFGFITRWMVAGPFDNSGGKGYEAVFPPEKGVDLNATYEGKENKKVRWVRHVSKEPLGVVDLNVIVGKLKGTVGFGFTVVKSDKAQPVEIRCGSNNAVRIYLNGAELYGREEYHHGMEMDQHVGKGILKAGRNEILVKVCQNEQTENWAELWSFQLRVTDSLGAPAPGVVVDD